MRISHIEARIEQQIALTGLISESYEDLIKPGISSLNVSRIQTRITILKEEWAKFSIVHEAIGIAIRELKHEDQVVMQNHLYFLEDYYNTTRAGYLDSLERMSSLLDSDQGGFQGSSSSHSHSYPSTGQQCFHQTRLPRIDLPKFNGTSSDWLSFKDLFQSLVLNNVLLTPVEKLQYLKTSLTGTAARFLKNTALTADNFLKAWESLNSFYENKRLLINTALHSLLSIRRITKESALELEQLYTNITQIYRSLETLQRPVAMWDDFLVFIATQRLDPESVKAWEQKLGSNTEPPTWKQFCDFLLARLLSLQAYEKSRQGKSTYPSQSATVKSHYQGKSGENGTNKTSSCSICSLQHYTSSCPQYNTKTRQQKLALINKHKLCYNCLGSHRVAVCRITKRCQKCGRRHHTSIHSDQSQNNKSKSVINDQGNSTSSTTNNQSSSETKAVHSSTIIYSATNKVLLATVQVQVHSLDGKSVPARALIDQGSEVSLISEKLAQQLHLTRKRSSIPLIGIGAKQNNKTKGIVSFCLRPHFDSTHQMMVTAHVLNKLTSSIPSTKINSLACLPLESLQLADPHYHTPGSIDILLGADYYAQIIKEGLIKGQGNTPIAQNTTLGWIISGPIKSTTKVQNSQVNHITIQDDVHYLLQKFWEVEEVPISTITSLSPEEQECEQHFKENHSRTPDGRYVVRLPLKQSPDRLGNSKGKAISLAIRLHKNFESNSSYAKLYNDFIFEYADLQHMVAIPHNSPEPLCAYYLPHHGVFRESSLTTKLRVVFNGSSKTTSGLSLNDILHTGPKLQTDLFHVLIWFRQFQYVFSADMEKMYRQIKVHPEDWKYQRIIWIDNSNQQLTYELTTVTYGLACAPFLALRSFKQLVEDEGHKFPLAINTVTIGRYVDDIFGGADSIEEAKECAQQVNNLCMAGGFQLRKWISNNQAIIASFSENQLPSSTLPIKDGQAIYSLGLNWQPTTDIFQFHLKSPLTDKATKRIILSNIAKIFDPLGFLAPIIIKAKLLMQELWIIRIDWDEPLPPSLASKWINFITSLNDLPMLSFPRWLGITSDLQIEIHGFADASSQAIAAVVYIRCISMEGKIATQFICAKTKVAPLKKATIPRLELLGTVLLSKLVQQVIKVITFENVPIHLWTDSMVAYTWINSHPSRWKDFICNRVCYIQEALPTARWGFVSGIENPADLATRGLSPRQLANQTSWWKGPQWLSQTVDHWPKNQPSISKKDTLEERPLKVNLTTIKPTECWNLLQRYSNLTKLLRITAVCQRAIKRFRKELNSSLHHPITITELKASKYCWVKLVQSSAFKSEINLLRKQTSLPQTNNLIRLTPFLDSDGILRVGGRLKASALPPDAKHPAILPKDHTFSSLIITDAHQKTLHGGTQVTLSFLREEFWILGGRIPVKNYIRKCVRCTRFRHNLAKQLMGQLPQVRVTPSRPFLHTGVDYAGPFTIKTWRGKNARTYKGYLLLFVCFSTSAVHLELVTDYTTEAFIAGYKRFTSRRGICSTLSSDCGTNFKGASIELQRLFTETTSESQHLASLLANHGTQWKFNPPSSPHFGGKWEAGVKSVKFHLKRVVGESLLTYEEMTTLLTQIEAILNSRPITPLSDDPEDLNPLTPGHFLLGCAPNIIPEPSLENVKTTRLSRWQLLRQMVESFWVRWSKECLQRYQSVYKWQKTSQPITEGSLVLVSDERYPPAKWPLGRVIKIHPGEDGLVRVVTLRTQSSVLKRPVVKLCPLPINSDTL